MFLTRNPKLKLKSIHTSEAERVAAVTFNHLREPTARVYEAIEDTICKIQLKYLIAMC